MLRSPAVLFFETVKKSIDNLSAGVYKPQHFERAGGVSLPGASFF